MTIKHVVVIGAGPAGLAAAIQLKRYKIDSILLEKEAVGGLLRNANLVENYPGFPNGISGKALVNLFRNHLANSHIIPRIEEVLEVCYQEDLFVVKTTKEFITSRVVIVASGTKPRELPDIDIDGKIKKRIFYEVWHLGHVANERIAIVGSGDAAFDYALNLSKKNEVIILNRGEKAKCLPLIFERALKNDQISYIENIELNDIKYHDDILALICQNSTGVRKIHASYLVIAIGRKPSLDFLSENVKMNMEKLQDSKRLYMIGDVQNGIYRQIAIAVGDGIKVAMEINDKLRRRKDYESSC